MAFLEAPRVPFAQALNDGPIACRTAAQIQAIAASGLQRAIHRSG